MYAGELKRAFALPFTAYTTVFLPAIISLGFLLPRSLNVIAKETNIFFTSHHRFQRWLTGVVRQGWIFDYMSFDVRKTMAERHAHSKEIAFKKKLCNEHKDEQQFDELLCQLISIQLRRILSNSVVKMTEIKTSPFNVHKYSTHAWNNLLVSVCFGPLW